MTSTYEMSNSEVTYEELLIAFTDEKALIDS